MKSVGRRKGPRRLKDRGVNLTHLGNETIHRREAAYSPGSSKRRSVPCDQPQVLCGVQCVGHRVYQGPFCSPRGLSGGAGGFAHTSLGWPWAAPRTGHLEEPIWPPASSLPLSSFGLMSRDLSAANAPTSGNKASGRAGPPGPTCALSSRPHTGHLRLSSGKSRSSLAVTTPPDR